MNRPAMSVCQGTVRGLSFNSRSIIVGINVGGLGIDVVLELDEKTGVFYKFIISSWWFQPLWKILVTSQNGNLPQIGVKKKIFETTT